MFLTSPVWRDVLVGAIEACTVPIWSWFSHSPGKAVFCAPLFLFLRGNSSQRYLLVPFLVKRRGFSHL